MLHWNVVPTIFSCWSVPFPSTFQDFSPAIGEQCYNKMYFQQFCINPDMWIYGHYGKLSKLQFNVSLSSSCGRKVQNCILSWWTQDLRMKHIYICPLTWFAKTFLMRKAIIKMWKSCRIQPFCEWFGAILHCVTVGWNIVNCAWKKAEAHQSCQPRSQSWCHPINKIDGDT